MLTLALRRLARRHTPYGFLALADREVVIKSPELRKRMEGIGAEAIGNSPEQMPVQIKGET